MGDEGGRQQFGQLNSFENTRTPLRQKSFNAAVTTPGSIRRQLKDITNSSIEERRLSTPIVPSKLRQQISSK